LASFAKRAKILLSKKTFVDFKFSK